MDNENKSLNLNEFVSEVRRIWLYSGIFMTGLLFAIFFYINSFIFALLISLLFIIIGIYYSFNFEMQVAIKYGLLKNPGDLK